MGLTVESSKPTPSPFPHTWVTDTRENNTDEVLYLSRYLATGVTIGAIVGVPIGIASGLWINSKNITHAQGMANIASMLPPKMSLKGVFRAPTINVIITSRLFAGGIGCIEGALRGAAIGACGGLIVGCVVAFCRGDRLGW